MVSYWTIRSDYKNDVINLSAEVIIKCYYQQGITQLIPYTLCKVVALKDKLQLITTDYSNIIINLDYKRIIEFKKLECPEGPFPGGSQGFKPYNGYLAIRYWKNPYFSDILFMLPARTTNEYTYNEAALKSNNIFDYVQRMLPPRDWQVIDL